MSTEVLILGALIAFAAAACQSVTGFGFALVMAPLLTVSWDVKPAIATSIILGLVLNAMLLLEVRGHASVPRASGLIAGYALGMPFGLLLLERAGGSELQILVAACVIIATILLYFQPEIDPKDDGLGIRLGVGAVSGITGASTSIGGPPAVLYLIGREREVSAFRATLLAFFLPTSLLATVAFVIVGRITEDVLTMTAVCTPPLIAGAILGSWMRRRLDPERFRTVVMAVLVATSATIIVFAVAG